MHKKKGTHFGTVVAAVLILGLCALFGLGGTVSSKKDTTTVAPTAAQVKETQATSGFAERSAGKNEQKQSAADPNAEPEAPTATPKPTKAEPTPTPEPEMVYISSKKSEVYHSKPRCSGMKNPKEITKEKAEKQGKRPCKKCH